MATQGSSSPPLLRVGVISLLNVVGAFTKAFISALKKNLKVLSVLRGVIQPCANTSLSLFRVLLDARPPIQPDFLHVGICPWLICEMNIFTEGSHVVQH